MGQINIEKIPPEEIKAMAGCLMASMKAFFENPENQRKFEEWKKNQKTA